MANRLSYAAALALFLSACASPPRAAPRFDRPSTVAIAVAHKQAQTHIAAARDKAVELANVVPPEFKLRIDSLETDLDSASSDVAASEGARKQLDAQLEQQTTRANTLADNYDKANAKIVDLQVSRHRYVKLLWGAVLLIIIEGVWIFRRPLLMLAGGV